MLDRLYNLRDVPLLALLARVVFTIDTPLQGDTAPTPAVLRARG